MNISIPNFSIKNPTKNSLYKKYVPILLVCMSLVGNISLLLGQSTSELSSNSHFNSQPFIDNFVWLDANENGLQDKDEVGISGVKVALYSDLNQVLITTLTDASGKYQFRDVPTGKYKIGITLPLGLTLSPPNQGVNDEIDSDIDTTTSKTAIFTLTAGQENLSVDIGLMPQNLLKAYIGDYVWNDLDANGIQHAHETGVQGITVELWDDAANLIRTTETDIFGQYVFTNVSQGFYVLRFTNLPLNWTLSSRNQGFDDNLDSDARASSGFTDTLQIYQGDRITHIDAGIYDISNVSAGRIGDFVWNDANADGLQNSGEIGMAGVNVTLYNFANIPIANTTTSEQGYYQFTSLGAGTYSIGFDNLPPNYVFSPKNIGSDTNIDSDVNQVSGRTDNFILGSNKSEISIDAGISLPTNTKGSLCGNIWLDLADESAQNKEKKCMGGVLVTLLDSASNALSTTISDANGRYCFNAVSAGTYQVHFTHFPLGSVFTNSGERTDNNLDSDANTSNGVADATYVVLAGQRTDVPDVSVLPPASIAGVAFEDNGAVPNGLRDKGEANISGVLVTLYDENDAFLRSMKTDKNGAYLFTGLTAGKYKIGFESVLGRTFTGQDAGENDNLDSDVDISTGKTDAFSLGVNQNKANIDASYLLEGTVFPVEVRYFSVEWINGDGLLKWGTTNEINLSHFEVWRSVNAFSFERILDHIPAKGNGINQNYKSFDFKVGALNADKVYYRLKMIDKEGQYTTSKTIDLLLLRNSPLIYLNIYPNPAQNDIWFDYQLFDSPEAEVLLLNAAGEVVYKSSVKAEANVAQFRINTASFARGMYYLKLQTEDASAIDKVVLD
jgi:protocatechuate 3,4-dioxygenase beta subunit